MNDHDEAHLFDGPEADEAEMQEMDHKAADWRADVRRDVVAKLVAYAALKDKITELDRELRTAGVEMFQQGDREMARIHDRRGQLVELGSVTRTKDSVTVKVVDEDVFFSAVLMEHPEAIIQVIDPTVRKAILDDIRRREAACWDTGEVIDGVEVDVKPGGLQVRKVEDIADKLPLIQWGSLLALEAPEGASRGPTALDVCPAACQVCKDLYEEGAPPPRGVLICDTCPECNPALLQASGSS